LVPADQAKATKAVQRTSDGAGLAAGIVGQSLVRRIALTIRAQATQQGFGDVVMVGSNVAGDAVRLGQELEAGALFAIQRPARADTEYRMPVEFGHD
jgi:hypothetical protein